MTTAETEPDGLLIALRHPLRRDILREMHDGEGRISPREISDRLKEPLSNVSYHIRVLAKCGVATLVDTAPVRGSMQHFYSSSVTEPWALQALGIKHNGVDGRQKIDSGEAGRERRE